MFEGVMSVSGRVVTISVVCLVINGLVSPLNHLEVMG